MSFVCMIPIKITHPVIPTEQFTRDFFYQPQKKEKKADVFKDKGVAMRLR